MNSTPPTAYAVASLENRYRTYLELPAQIRDSPNVKARIEEIRKELVKLIKIDEEVRGELAKLEKTDLMNEKGWLSDSSMSPSNKIHFTMKQLGKLEEIGVNTKQSDEITADIQKGLVELKNLNILMEKEFKELEDLLKQQQSRKVVAGCLPLFFTSRKN